MQTEFESRFADVIRSHLDRMLRSEKFEASERNRRFLKYVVDETLEGRANRIKAYSIATVALGRGDDFDPQTDPVVRIEAHRLRRALAYYYLTEGKDDPIRIDIPKGSYVPAFERTDEADPDPAPAAERAVDRTVARVGIPRILVAAFEEEGDQSAFPNLVRGFTRQVVAGLTRFSDLAVLGTDTAFLYSTLNEEDRGALEQQVDFIVGGGCAISGNRFSVEALLIDSRSKEVIWGETFERDLRPEDMVVVRDEVANCIVRALAQSYGVIFARLARDVEGRAPTELSSCECVVRFHQYWRTFDRDMHGEVRACLERTILRDPSYPEAFACLSQIYTDAVRFGFAPVAEHEVLLQQSFKMARRAIELAPRSSRAHHALALTYWFSGDLQSGMEAMEAAMRLNPNASEIMAELGHRYLLCADWERGIPLMEESYRRNPAQPGTFRMGLMLYHFAHDRYSEALAEARKVDAPHLVFGHLAEALALLGLGRRKEAMKCIDRVEAIDPAYLGNVEKDLSMRYVAPELASKIIRMLQSANRPTGLRSVKRVEL